jgi:hypothetical protein
MHPYEKEDRLMNSKRIPSENAEIYCLKISLKSSKPPIWRRVEIYSHTTLADLHRIIQVSMGWEFAHLWEFKKGDSRYGDLQYEDEDVFFSTNPLIDSNLVRIFDVLFNEKSKMIYQYDFGDCWDHEIVLEKRFPPEPDVFYPRCVNGKMACPPEDCGGLPGYYNNLNILDNPKNNEYKDVRTWMREDFDPNQFDMEKVNKALKKIT